MTKTRFFILLITLVLGALFFTLFKQLQKGFVDVDERLASGTMMNLNDKNPGKGISKLLEKGYYFEDKADVAFIEKMVSAGITSFKGDIDNIGELNKRNFFAEADIAYAQGGENFRKRVSDSRSLLGYSGEDAELFKKEIRNPAPHPNTIDLHTGKYNISGKVLNQDKKPVAGVLIKLQMILPQDSAYAEAEDAFTESDDRNLKKSLIAYLRTGKDGRYAFNNLPEDKAFSVLPLQPGFQFGRSQGIQELQSDATFNFKQSPHMIRLFSTRDFKILKKEKSLIVRTPEEYNRWYWIIVASFFAGFLLMQALISLKFPQADPLILPVIMLMTGLSFITLLSLQDPLRDRFLAKDSLIFYGMGILGIMIMVFINFRKLTVDSGFYRMFVLNRNTGKANGWQWAGMALALLALTIVFGTGPEGSGVKVNLFGVQPSEIVKYAIILFLAGFLPATNVS